MAAYLKTVLLALLSLSNSLAFSFTDEQINNYQCTVKFDGSHSSNKEKMIDLVFEFTKDDSKPDGQVIRLLNPVESAPSYLNITEDNQAISTTPDRDQTIHHMLFEGESFADITVVIEDQSTSEKEVNLTIAFDDGGMIFDVFPRISCDKI